jgi:transcription elongation factor Elf1
LLALLLALSGCGGEEETKYELFNCEEDVSFIYVGIDEVLEGDACTGYETDGDGIARFMLRSSSCNLPDDVNVGEVAVSPCGAPIGTQHQIVVTVYDLYKQNIAKVSARLDSKSRGADEYDMEPDSADEGLYELTLVSVGSDGE